MAELDRLNANSRGMEKCHALQPRSVRNEKEHAQNAENQNDRDESQDATPYATHDCLLFRNGPCCAPDNSFIGFCFRLITPSIKVTGELRILGNDYRHKSA
jgi:hypothetical protein